MVSQGGVEPGGGGEEGWQSTWLEAVTVNSWWGPSMVRRAVVLPK